MKYKSIIVVTFFGMAASFAFGSGQPMEQSFDLRLLNAVRSSDLETAQSLMQEMTPNRLDEYALKKILAFALRSAAQASPRHFEAMQVLELFLKEDGKGFKPGDEDQCGFNASPWERLWSAKVMDAVRLIRHDNAAHKVEVFEALLKPHLGPFGLTELLWAIELNSNTLVRLVLNRFPSSYRLIVGRSVIEPVLSKQEIDINIISALVDSHLFTDEWATIRKYLPHILNNEGLSYQLLQRNFDSEWLLRAEWADFYSDKLTSVLFPLNDFEQKEVKRLLALFLIKKGKIVDLGRYISVVKAALEKGDHLIFKLLARQMPKELLDPQKEFTLPNGEVWIDLPRSLPKSVFEKLKLYYEQYRKQFPKRMMAASRAPLGNEVARINRKLRKIIHRQTVESMDQPGAEELYPLAGKNIVLRNDDLRNNNLTYLAAKMIVENNDDAVIEGD